MFFFWDVVKNFITDFHFHLPWKVIQQNDSVMAFFKIDVQLNETLKPRLNLCLKLQLVWFLLIRGCQPFPSRRPKTNFVWQAVLIFHQELWCYYNVRSTAICHLPRCSLMSTGFKGLVWQTSHYSSTIMFPLLFMMLIKLGNLWNFNQINSWLS